MLIKVLKELEEIYLEIDGERKKFEFNTLDEIIEKFVNINDELEIECDEDLLNYKNLLKNLKDEVRSEEFTKALTEITKYQ